ncbi:MAG TPA: VIT domain-containing protein [Casimicrobiaceae bacterium]
MGHEAAVLKSIAGATMSLLGVEARGRVDGLLFELAVEQRYRNATATNVEAVYTFPLPWGAALLELEVRLGEKLLTGVVVEKRAAEAQYEEAIDEGDTAIMLERAGDGLCTVNLGNLMPGEEATIRYVYAQTLRFEQGSVRLTVPTVIAPRYGNPADAGSQPHQVPSSDFDVDYPFTLSIGLSGPLAKGSIASPSHPIAVTATERGVAAALARTASLDRDFVLAIGALASQSTAVLAKDGEGYVALASFCVPAPASSSKAPLRLKLVVDCSGSMAGDSIAAAKRALHRILEGLQSSDRFSLSVFGSNVQHLVGTLTEASAPAIANAASFAGRIDANMGGTEMEAALESVFEIGGDEGAADVLLMTDGEIMAADSLVAAARRAGQRLFAVGIGSAPAEAVLRKLAEATDGACEFVAPGEDVESGILRMFARLRSPRIERVDISWPQTPRWTTPLPRALFGGETIHVYAGFDALPAGNATAALCPSSGDATPLTASTALPAQAGDEPLIARMAALARMAGADAETQLRLALDYRLLTDRTNFVVVHVRDEEHKANELPQLQKIAQMHAAGWGGMGSVTGRLAQARISHHMVSPLLLKSAHSMSVSTSHNDLEFVAEAADSRDASMQSPTAGATEPDQRAVSQADWTAVLRALDARYTASWLGRLPTTLAEIRDLRIPSDVWQQIASSCMAGAKERVVVYAFLAALEPWAAAAGVSRQFARALRRLCRGPHGHAWLRERLADLVGKPAPQEINGDVQTNEGVTQ